MTYNKLFTSIVKLSLPLMLVLIFLSIIFDSFYLAITAMVVYIIDMTLTFNNKSLPIEFCHELSWHLSPINKKYVGINMSGVCPRCGKEIMLDSQGNWF